MDWFLSNWYVVLVVVVVVLFVGYLVWKFCRMPKAQQIEKVKEWLIWACIEAEKHLGKGTGEVKLLEVYNNFLKVFPWLAKVVSYDQFKLFAEESLTKAKALMENNKEIKGYVETKVLDTKKK